MLGYTTIQSPVSVEIPKIKGSRFIGHIFCVQSKSEAENTLKQVQKLHHQATHNCRAYRVGVRAQEDLFGNWSVESERVYANDDGEPSGTASYPMKNTLAGAKLENVLLVVTRYFGGTLLGVGGLVKAYTDASKAVIAQAKFVTKPLVEEISVTIAQTQVPAFLKFCHDHQHEILQENYGDVAHFVVAVGMEKKREFFEKLKVEN